MNKKKVLLSAIASFTLLSIQAMAEQTQSAGEVDVWETEVISSSLNLGKDSIETKQANHLSDLLRDLPGVDVGGTHSINNRINIRGLQDENLDITIDGAKVQNVNMFHHIGNLLINPDILKKANIQVGTNSVANGGLGGSVSFETKDGKDLLEDGKNYGARIQANYNSNDSRGGSIAGYGKADKLSFLIYHNYVNKNNWEDGSGQKTFGVDGDISDTLVKATYDIDDKQSVSVSYDYLKDEGDYSPRPDFGRAYQLARTGTDTFPTEYTRETITLNHKLDLGDNLYLNMTAYSNSNELERYEGPLSSGAAVRPGAGISNNLEGELYGEVKTVGINAKAQSLLQLANTFHTITYGALYDKQTSEVTWNGDKYGDDEKATTLALYLEDAIDFENGFILTPGVRYTHYKLDGSYGIISDDQFTYGLAAQYALTDTVTLHASATTLYKGVEMVDVLSSARVTTNENENLESETGINKEVGFKYIDYDVLGADTFGFSINFFQTKIYDYIEVNSNNMENVGTLKINGYEASLVYDIGNLNTLLTYSHSSSIFKNSGEPLEKEPGDSLSLGLDYKVMPNLILSWDSLFVFSEDKVLSGTAYSKKESYDVHDLAVNYKPKAVKGLTIIAGIDNVFDEEYVSHTSENRLLKYSGADYLSTDYEPGRNFKITLAYKF